MAVVAPEWSLRRYAALCETLVESGYRPCTMDAFLQGESKPPTAILRHDVDRFPGDALAMAGLEAEQGIHATYYVRMTAGVYSPRLVDELHHLGHEVGYHYEVLHRTRGDVAAALDLFARELAELRTRVPVTTATAHGSPLSRWDSIGIWDAADPARFGLVGEPYLAIDPTRVAYYTDTGRSWNATATNLRDRPARDGGDFPRVTTTAALEAVISARTLPAVCIQTHPERWHDHHPGRARSLALDMTANTVKRVLALGRRGRGAGGPPRKP